MDNAITTGPGWMEHERMDISKKAMSNGLIVDFSVKCVYSRGYRHDVPQPDRIYTISNRGSDLANNEEGQFRSDKERFCAVFS